ncbi:S8 family serine peptidase [Gottfriedia acidiceleris]|uniref:S8 family serine peptidase n=1 Tax=Gottfriedia acidiceleris TaxID=371036 RepID=A0ABY4JFB6_9BACI|nr:S8 family serine peptidase [Gottfriedia acidiceleris]UPM52528.1 S8 family serine peptidase [Gottfriedia acidiceleris]
MDVIVQFDADPAAIQLLNQQKSSKSGVGINQQSTPVTLESAKEVVSQNHSDFKSFISSESKRLKATGETNSIKTGREYTDVFNGIAVKIPKASLTSLLAQPFVKSVYLNVQYAPIPSTKNIDAASSATGDGVIQKESTNPNVLPTFSRQTTTKTTSSVQSPASKNTIKPLAGSIPSPGPEGSQSGETPVLDWLKIHDLQNEGVTGKGVKVGVIDTGIDYNHPDLKDLYQGGHDFVDDDNDPMETVYADWLAAKNANDALPPEQRDPYFPDDYHEYITSHGTHVSGTIAGDSRNNSPYALRGVAPEVQLYGYRVLGPHGGSDEDVIAGIEQSYRDGCQVINLSLGSNINDSLSSNAVAINNVTDLGVTAVIAAGNSGPGVGSIGTPGAAPKAITVGAMTFPKPIPTFDIHSFAPNNSEVLSFNTRLLSKEFSDSDTKISGSTPFDIVDVGYGTPEWYTSVKNKGVDVTNKVVLVKRGAGAPNALAQYAKEAHAKAMIMWNPTDNPALIFDDQGYYPFFFGPGNNTLYTLQINKEDGTNFYNQFKAGAIKTVSISNAGNFTMGGNKLADFSSTGPVTGSLAIKPDLVAPGVDVYSAAPFDIASPTNTDYSTAYQSMSGTSMATPHVAGMAALILASHPNYKPEDVKVALMETSDNLAQQYSLFQVGSGKSDPYQAVHSDMLFKVKDYIQSRTSMDDTVTNNYVSIPNTTGSFSFGYTPRQVDGSVSKSGDLYITNNGTSAKTFDSSSVFFKDSYVKDGRDGASEGAKVSLANASAPGTPVTSITVPAGQTVHVVATFTAPDSAASGYYEAYVNFVNQASPSETYRLPLAINVQSRGVDFRVQRKAITLTGNKNFNPNTFAVLPQSYAELRVKSPLDPVYGLRLYLMDVTGKNYIGYLTTVNTNSLSLGNLSYIPFLTNGSYYPYTTPISKDDPNLTLKLSQQSSTPKITDEGGYIVQARALDATTGHLYELNSSVYVDNTPPTMEMDANSQPGIYEIDPDGPSTNGALKWFSGKAYDSNVDYMKNVGKDTAVPKPPNYDTDTNVSQSLGRIDGMLGDSNSAPYVNYFIDMEADGNFKFGISKEDLVNTTKDPQKEMFGTQFRIYPEDYSFAGNLETQGRYYYFVKKGNEYSINRFKRLDSPGSTTLNGIDPSFLANKTLVGQGDNFQSTLSIKYPKNLVGANFFLDEFDFADRTNIDFSPAYKAFLQSKGILADKNWIVLDKDVNSDMIVHFNLPDNVKAQGVLNTSDTLQNGVAQEMPILDITYKVVNDTGLDTIWLQGSGNIPFITTYQNGTTGIDRIPIFQDKHVFVKGGAMVTGDIRPEGFQNNPTSPTYGRSTPLTAENSGAEIRFEDPNAGGESFTLPVAQDPTASSSSDNQGLIQNGLFTTKMPLQAGTKPYNFTMKTPGHFTYYGTLAVNAAGQYGYAAGGRYSVPRAIMLAGDVNNDNVIDMKDIEAESRAYNDYVATPSTVTRNADLNFDGSIDYSDFEYIIKNFGKINDTAPNAANLTATTKTSADLTLTGFATIPSGSDLTAFNSVIKPVPYMKTSDSVASVYFGKVNPFQLFSVAYKAPDVSTGVTTLTQIDDAAYRAAIDGTGGQIQIDGVDRKSATNTYNGVVVNSIQDKVVSSKGQFEMDPSLFQTSGVHTIRFKAPGYMDRFMKFKMTNGAGNSFSLLAPNNVTTIGKPLTFTRADGTGSTAAHYRDVWMPNINKITVTDPSGAVAKTYTGTELQSLFNVITPANQTTFNFTIPAGVFTTPSINNNGTFFDWKIVVEAKDYDSYTFSQRINANPAPTLTSETNRYFDDSNTNPISITAGGTNDTQQWRDAITAIQIGNNVIKKADFAANNITVGAPNTPIIIPKSLMTTPGLVSVSVMATNYQTVKVDQPLYKQGITLTKPAGTIYAGQDLVLNFTPGTKASDWINAMKTSGTIKFGSTVKTRIAIDETAGTITIPYDLVRTNGGGAVAKTFTVTASGYADNNVSITVTPQPAPVLTLSAPSGTPQYGDTVTYTMSGADNPLWRSSLFVGATTETTTDNGDVKFNNTSVKPYVTSVAGSVTIDGYATQSNTAAGNKTINFVSPYFATVSITQAFVQRPAPTPTVTTSGVGKQVVIKVPNTAENTRWANATKAASGDITVGGVSVKGDSTISSTASAITMTLPGSAFPAQGNVPVVLKAYCYPDTTVTQVVKLNPPTLNSKIAYVQETTPITINFASSQDWLNANPVLTLNGEVVDSSKYTLSATGITFVDRSLFQAVDVYGFTLSAPNYVDAKFTIFISDELAHLISVTTDTNGTISPNGWVEVKHGDNQPFTITPNEGYEIATLKVDGVKITPVDNSYMFTNVTANHTIDVTFKQIVYKMTVSADAHGSITPNGNVNMFYGTDQTFVITPENGYVIDTLTVDGDKVAIEGNTFTLKHVTAQHTIHVTFKDITAPIAPIVNAVTNTSTTIVGKAEKGSHVVAKIGTKVIGEATASSTGDFTIKIAKQAAGTKILVSATDASSNESAKTTVIVKDVIAPNAPVVKVVKDSDKVVTGKTEAGATVTVLVGTKVIGSVKATSTGTFSITIPVQKAGTILKVIAKDAAGNSSKATTVTVIDKTAPAKPVIVKATSTSITGKAEKGSVITVKVGKKVVGTATTNQSGQFTVKFAKQRDGTTFTITAKDKAGNTSVATTIKK